MILYLQLYFFSYVLKYMSKSESTGIDMSLREVSDDKGLWHAVHKLALSCLKQRQEGVYEAIDDLMGRPIVQKSRTVSNRIAFIQIYKSGYLQVEFVDTNPPNNRKQYMISAAELAELPADSTDWVKLNMLNNHFKHR